MGFSCPGVTADPGSKEPLPSWLKVFLVVAVLLGAGFLVFHLASGGFGPHGG